MANDRDFFQRHAESPVRLPRLLRAILGAVVLLGAVFLVGVGGLLFFAADRSQMPNPSAAILLILFLVALGCAFAYVGMRLFLMRTHTEHLMNARAARVASYCIAAAGVLMLLGSLVSWNPDFASAGLFALLMAYWLYASTRKIGRGA